jgi:hypothetical protein
MIEVEWFDARTRYEEYTFKEAPEKCQLVRRVTCGYLVMKDRERLVLAHTYDPAEEGGEEGGQDFTTIPRGWIKNIVTFEATTKESED